jgi:hypothetical protein
VFDFIGGSGGKKRFGANIGARMEKGGLGNSVSI